MIKRISCFFLGHGRSMANRIVCDMTERGKTYTHFCGSCGAKMGSLSLVKAVPAHMLIPRGYGIAWLDWRKDQAMAMPIPLNVLVSGARKLWLWMKYPRPLARDPFAAYRDGFEAGRKSNE